MKKTLSLIVAICMMLTFVVIVPMTVSANDLIVGVDFATIEEAAAAAVYGDVIVLEVGGTYLLSETLEIPAGVTVQGNGAAIQPGATFDFGGSSNDSEMPLVRTNAGVVLDDLIVQGPALVNNVHGGQNFRGIEANGDITLTNVTVQNIHGPDGMNGWTTGRGLVVNTGNATVTDSAFRNINRNSIEFGNDAGAVGHLVLEGSTFITDPQYVNDPNLAGKNAVVIGRFSNPDALTAEIRDNEFEGFQSLSTGWSSAAIFIASADDVVVDGNTITDADVAVLSWGPNTGDVTVTGNTFTNSTFAAVSIDNGGNVVVNDNYFVDSDGYDIRAMVDVDATDNNFSGIPNVYSPNNSNIDLGNATIGVGPNDSLQAAINAANPGDTIIVSAGTFYENIIINTPITLFSEDGAVISGAVWIQAGAVGTVVDGLTFTYGGNQTGDVTNYLVTVGADDVTFQNNIFDGSAPRSAPIPVATTDNLIGITGFSGIQNMNVINNVFTELNFGAYFNPEASSIHIEGNLVENGVGPQNIGFAFVASDDVTITRNFFNNVNGLRFEDNWGLTPNIVNTNVTVEFNDFTGDMDFAVKTANSLATRNGYDGVLDVSNNHFNPFNESLFVGAPTSEPMIIYPYFTHPIAAATQVVEIESLVDNDPVEVAGAATFADLNLPTTFDVITADGSPAQVVVRWNAEEFFVPGFMPTITITSEVIAIVNADPDIEFVLADNFETPVALITFAPLPMEGQIIGIIYEAAQAGDDPTQPREVTTDALITGFYYDLHIYLSDFPAFDMLNIPLAFTSDFIEIVDVRDGLGMNSFDYKIMPMHVGGDVFEYSASPGFIGANVADGLMLLTLIPVGGAAANVAHDLEIPYMDIANPDEDHAFIIVRFRANVTDNVQFRFAETLEIAGYDGPYDGRLSFSFLGASGVYFDTLGTQHAQFFNTSVIFEEYAIEGNTVISGIAQLAKKVRTRIPQFGFVPRVNMDAGISVQLINAAGVPIISVADEIFTNNDGAFEFTLPGCDLVQGVELAIDGTYTLRLIRRGTTLGFNDRHEMYMVTDITLEIEDYSIRGGVLNLSEFIAGEETSFWLYPISMAADGDIITANDYQEIRNRVGMTRNNPLWIHGVYEMFDINEHTGIDGGDLASVRSSVGLESDFTPNITIIRP